MSIKWGSASRPNFKQDFFRLVDARVEVAGRIMPGCDRKEYESYSARHSRLFEGICRRLGEGDRGLLAEFDFTAEVLAAFDIDNEYIQGFEYLSMEPNGYFIRPKLKGDFERESLPNSKPTSFIST